MLATGYGRCFDCGVLFSFNPVRVPSLPAHLSRTGQKEPICQACVDRANPTRVKNGLPPIVPAADAYEPCEDHEL